MATLPQLIEEDVQQIDETLREFLAHSDATVAALIDKGGFLLSHQGEAGDVDMTTLGALASGAFMASQTIAGLVSEKDFHYTCQQGEQSSLFTMNVDEHCLMVVIFPSKVGLGVVRYYSVAAVKNIARQLAIARERDPEGGLDLSVLNVAEPRELFRKKTT